MSNFFKNHKQNLLLIILIFIITRVLANKWGVSTHDTQWLTQTFDISLMQNNLLKNVFYDLYQAPLLNLSVGLFVKLFGSKWQFAIMLFFSFISLLLIIETYLILTKLEISRSIVFYVILFFLVLNPTLIYYERYIIYHTPIAFLLVNTILFFIYFIETKRIVYLFTVYFTLSIIVSYRTSFTLYWFIGISLIIILLLKEYKKQLIAILFPLSLILAIYFKNYIIFGVFASSNMVGNNLASFTSFVHQKIKNEAIATNKVSKFYSVGIWINDLNSFKPYLKDTIIPERFKNVGVLNYPTSGVQISHHHYYKHEILSQLYQDGKYLVLQDPICLIKGFVWGLYVYFMPQGDYIAHINNVKKIYWWNRIYNIYFNGQIDPKRREELNYQVPFYYSPNGEVKFSELFESMDIGKIGLFTVLGYILILINFILFIINIIFNKWILTDKSKIMIFIYVLFFYLASLYIVLGSFENNRLRFELIGLETILITISINLFKNKSLN